MDEKARRKRSYAAGYLLSLAGKPLPLSTKREPVAYLYNGVRLPKLPEWDREKLPYALISNSIMRPETYWITFCSCKLTADCAPVDAYCTNQSGYGGTTANVWTMGKINENVESSYVSPQPGTRRLIWSNFDILDESGNVVLAASDPIPVYESVDADAHSHEYTAVVIAPTCTEKGYTRYTCSCGHSYTDNEVEALGHNYESVVTAPTCAEKGFTTHACTRCGDSYKDNYTDKIWHNNVNGNCAVCGCTIQKVEISDVTKQAGAAVHAATGELNYQWSNNWIADIPIPEGAKQVRFQAVQSTKSYGSAFLTANKEFISGYSTNEYYPTVFLDIPANARIFRYGQNYDCKQAIEFAI